MNRKQNRIKFNSIFKLKTFLFILSILLVTSANAASIYFNELFKGTGTTYTANTSTITNITTINGSGFKFTSLNPADTIFKLTGNNVSGVLTYINASGVLQTISGQISRQDKGTGGGTNGLYFFTSTGESFLLVIPGYTSYSANKDVKTSSDPILKVINDVLTTQNSSPKILIDNVNVKGTDGYAVFTVSLTSALGNSITFTPSLTAVTATLNTDYTSSMQYNTGSSWSNITSSVSILAGVTSLKIRVPIINVSSSTNKTFNLNTGPISVSGSSTNVLNNDGAYGIGTIIYAPTITTIGLFSPFNACIGFVSNEQSFTVSGISLTNNISISAPTGYEISLTSGSGFSSSVSIIQSGGTVSSTSIYVRLKSDASNGANGNVSITSTGATTQTIATGTAVISALPTITLGSTSPVNTTALSFSLPYTAKSDTSVGKYSITTGTPALSGFSAITNAILPSSSSGSITVTIPASIANTYGFNITVNDTLTGCVSNPISFNQIITGPTINVSGSLTTFTTCAGTASASQTFTVSGTYLTANIVATAPTGYEISSTAGSGYGSTVTLTQVGGTVSSTTLYARLTNAAINAASGTISLTSTGATTNTISTGTAVVNALPTIALGSTTTVGTTATSFSLPYTATSGSPDKYSITATTPTMASFSAVSNATLTSSPISVTIPASTANTYGFNITVKNSTTSCVSSPTSFTQIISIPVISTTGSLTSFTTCAGTASASQTFTVTGSYLTANLVATAPTGYEISSSAGSGYGSTVTLTQVGGTVSSTTLYARLTSAAINAASGTISLTSTGATTNTISTGTAVVNALPTITLGSTTAVSASATSFSLPYTATTGSPNQYSITSTSPAISGFSAVTNAALSSSPIAVSIPASTANTYGFNITVKNSTTSCVSSPTSFTQTIIGPTITTSGTLTTFTTCAGTASASQTFTVSGTYLTADIVATAPTGYEISLSAGSGYGSTVTLTQVGGTISSTTLYARLTNAAINAASGTISLTSTGATTKTISTGTAVVNTLPTINTTTPGSRCETGTVTLGATASSGIINWYTTSTNGSSVYSGTSFTTPSISTSTTYYVDATTNGCTTNTRTAIIATVNVAPITPTATLTNPTCSIANGTISVTSGTSGLTFNLSGAGSYSNTTGVFNTIASGNYSLTSTNGTGCVSNALGLTINAQPPTPTAPVIGTITQTTCSSSTGTIALSGLPSGTWTVTETGGTTITGSTTTANFTNLSSGTYTFTVSNGTCTSVASLGATINPQPTTPTAPVIGTITQTTCSSNKGTIALSGLPSGTWTVTATGGTTITGSTTTANFTNLSAGTYTFTVSNGTCTSVASLGAVIDAQPLTPTPATITGSVSVCAGANITLTSSGTWSATSWSSGTSSVATVDAFGVVNGLTAGTSVITYTITNSSGCSSSTSKMITVNALPTFNITSVPDITTTENAFQIYYSSASSDITSFTLTSTSFSGTFSSTGTFNPAASFLSIPISGLVIGTYSFTINLTNSTGCVSTNYSFPMTISSVDAGHIGILEVGVYKSEKSICQTNSIIQIGNEAPASTGALYQWQYSIAPSALTEAYIDITTDATSSTYTITAGSITQTTHFRRVASISPASSKSNIVTLLVNPIPSAPTASVTDPTCSVSTGTISVTSSTSVLTFSIDGSTYSNTTGVFSALPSGNYTLTAKNNSGCISTALAVTLNTQPVTPSPSSITGATNVCEGRNITLTSTGTWSATSWSSATSSVATVDASGVVSGLTPGTSIITYTITNTSGCSSSTSTTITVNALPVALTASVTNPTCTLSTGTISVTSSTMGLSFSLESVSGTVSNTTGIFNTLSSGNYTLTASNLTGCVSNALGLTINVQPTIPATPTITVSNNCGSSTLSTTATGTLLWNTGETSSTITVTNAGTYTLTQTVGSCISGVASATTSPLIIPSVSIGTITQVNTTSTSFDIPFTINSGAPIQYALVTSTPAMTGFNAIPYSTLNSSPIAFTFPISSANTYGFSISFKNSSNCTSSNTINLTVVNASLGASTIVASGTVTYTYNGSAQGPITSNVTGSTATPTYSYSGTGTTIYGPSSTPPTTPGTYQLIASVGADVNFNGASSSPYSFTINKATSTVIATGTISFTYNGSAQGPITSSVTGSTATPTYSYSGTGITSYGPSAIPPTNAGSYQVIASVSSDSNYKAASSSPLEFVINTPIAIQPQGGITSVDYKLLSTDTVKIKVNLTAGVAPFTLIVSNSRTITNDTLRNVISGTNLLLKPTDSSTTYKILKIVDANNQIRTIGFTKDTTLINILVPSIALTLKAEDPVKQYDNSYKTRLYLKIKNTGNINLGNVQINANLSSVFPADIIYILDSIRVVKGNIKINPNYKGDGISKTASSPVSNIKFETINGIKSSSTNILDANYLLDYGVNLLIGEDADIVYYLSIAQTTKDVTLKLQFATAGFGELVKFDGSISNSGTTSISDDGNLIDQHPLITLKGTPAPTYLPLNPIQKLGASLFASSAKRVATGYIFHFISTLKNYGNTNIDSLLISNSFTNTFTAPDSAFLINTPTIKGNLILNNLFNGYAEPNLVKYDGRLVVGDSASIEYDVYVKTSKEKNTWLTYQVLSGSSTLNSKVVIDTSTNGLDPDPNKDGSVIEKELTRFYINYNRPLPPSVVNAQYILGQSIIPSSLSTLVKSTPTGSIPVWCDINTSQCSSTPPTLNTLIGKYVYQLRSYDTVSLLFSDEYINDTVIIGPPTPIVKDSTYVIGVKTNPLNVGVQVIGMSGSTLNYYIKGIKQSNSPNLPSMAGLYNFVVTQTVNNIESDSAIFKVTILNMEDVIHLQKLVAIPILQTNSTFNITFTFIASNLTKYAMDNVVISDNLQVYIPISSEYSILSTTSTGGLVSNTSYNGNSNIVLTSASSKLGSYAKDTVRFVMNFIPKGFAGQLSNVADISANARYGFVSIKSSSSTKALETTKLPTYYTIPQLPISIPEGFSPNHDGVNDRFVIIKPYGTVIDLSIFNRWGNVVYTNSNYNNDWDGKGTDTYFGKDLLDGGYYYSINAKDIKGATQVFKGFIIIQR